MGTPWYHSEMSAKRFGGEPSDYLAIHNLMDSSKAAFSDLRHRALTHNSWFVTTILERIFGETIENSDGKKVAVRDIGQFHIMEDFKGGFPSASDYLSQIKFADWMNNGEGSLPPSNAGLPAPDQKKLFMEEDESPEELRGSDTNRGCAGLTGLID